MALSLLYTQTNSGSYLCLYDNCRFSCEIFEELIDHLVSHDIKLIKDVDFCSSCRILFGCKFSSLQHWLSHAVDAEIFSRDVSEIPEKSHNWLQSAFQEIANIRKELWNQFLAQDPPLEEEVPESQTFDTAVADMANGNSVLDCI